MSKLISEIRPKFIVWTNYGFEGWSERFADSFDEAVKLRDEQMGLSNREAIITEYIPLNVKDGRIFS